MEGANKHWDRVKEFIDSLEGAEKLRIQKLNTAYYLDYYHLTVTYLKECFESMGIYEGTADDEFDDALIHAIIRFQVEQDLPHIDGIFGPLTYEALTKSFNAGDMPPRDDG